jgi:MoaA/NifB/PqqE/SkfB family radical SAM enzyme
MCNIWQHDVRDALEPEHLRTLPVSLRTVNLSGGEPFLRDDLPDLVAAVRQRCPRATIAISTNGLATEKIIAAVRAIGPADPRVRVAVSIDGLGETHDRIRGVEGAFERAMDTLDQLRDLGCRGLRMSMTVSADNAGQVGAVADLAAARGLELGVVAAQAAGTQLHVDALPSDLPDAHAREVFEDVVARWLRSARPKRWLRAHFTAMTWRYLCGQRWENISRPGEEFFFLQSDATVYTSSVSGEPMGNLCQDTWDDLWSSPQAAEARAIETARPHRSWMICTARRYYRHRRAAVLGWVFRSKLRSHFRAFHLPNAEKAGGAHANPAH